MPWPLPHGLGNLADVLGHQRGVLLHILGLEPVRSAARGRGKVQLHPLYRVLGGQLFQHAQLVLAHFPVDVSPPASGQGVLAVHSREIAHAQTGEKVHALLVGPVD